MNTSYFIKVAGIEYPTRSIDGRLHDSEWDDRHSKTFRIEMTYEDAHRIFTDGVDWSIVSVTENEETQESIVEVFDNSDFNLAGNITDHRDGTLSITMGKMTDLEEILTMIYGIGEAEE